MHGKAKRKPASDFGFKFGFFARIASTQHLTQRTQRIDGTNALRFWISSLGLLSENASTFCSVVLLDKHVPSFPLVP